jgi:hypothetical protein
MFNTSFILTSCGPNNIMSSTCYLTSCPDGKIPDPDDGDGDDGTLKSWTQLETTMGTEFANTKTKRSHLAMALRLLRSSLVEMYQKPCIEALINSSSHAGECDRFSMAVCAGIAANRWSKGTAYKILALLKKVLLKTTIPEGFVKRIKYKGPSKTVNRAIGKHGKLQSDAPSRVLLESWATLIKQHSRCRSDLSVRNIISFIVGSALKPLGLSVDAWPADVVDVVEERLVDESVVEAICQGKYSDRKLRWLQIFLTFIVKSPHIISSQLKLQIAAQRTDETNKNDDDDDDGNGGLDDGTDLHRISSADLDALYTASTNDTMDELLYLLMITTGMRIGGVANIKTLHVVAIRKKAFVVLGEGRTREKGNKWFQFVTSSRVRVLILSWLNETRPADPSPYLFPGQSNGRISTSTIRLRFNKMCTSAGLTGMEFHPHALRHSYAHILLESGNTPDVVSKLLNHASVKTTEQFYIRENAVQVCSRANIPWMKNQESVSKVEPLPKFLSEHARGAGTRGLGHPKRLGTLKRKLAALNASNNA